MGTWTQMTLQWRHRQLQSGCPCGRAPVRWMEPWVYLLREGIMLQQTCRARLNVNTKSSADSSPLTATQRHSKLRSQVRGPKRDRDEGRGRIGSEGEGEESGKPEQFRVRQLMMNAGRPRLNSCIINITGNKLEFHLASQITNKAIFLTCKRMTLLERRAQGETVEREKNTDSRHLFSRCLPVKFRDPNRP